MTVRELGNHAVSRVVGLYSTSSLRSVRDVRMDWYWIGVGLDGIDQLDEKALSDCLMVRY